MPPKGKATHFSSAKAAEALAARGGGRFGGFSGSTPVGAAGAGFAFGSKYVGQVAAAVPGAAAAAAAGDAGGARAAAAIIPADLDGELAQQLQKLSKRDATTKLKALQALRTLAKDKPAADLQAALPSWTYLFSRLVMDGNRAVRAEACHVTAALAAAVGRGIAPLLKSLLPPLWLAQFDSYGEAAAAARGAFAAAFPAAAKQREAVLFCRAEVLQLLSDNLASTPQSLGDAKKESAEELADRHERVLAATCGALAALLELAAPSSRTGQPGAAAGAAADAAAAAAAEPSAAEQEVLAGIQSQLELPAFYKSVLQSKAAPVRRAAYGLVAAAAERRPQLLAGSLAVSAAAVLGSLGDKEPANHEAMWGMLLAYAQTAPDSWRHVNVHKAFLPRLWALLRHGCHGSATASYPALLPLVSLLPKDVLGPRPAFFASLLEAIWQGLPTLAGPGGGPAARQAAAVAFQDCLLYALLKSDQLATAGSSEAAAAAAPTQQAQRDYCAELLQAAVAQLLMPAVTAGAAAPEAAAAAEAQAVLAGTVGRLSSPTASASSRERLDQLLQVVGDSLAAAMQQALGGGAAEQQPEAGSSGAAAAPTASSSELCERAAKLVAALEQAAGPPGHAALGAAVAQPQVALLLPEVRSGSAPPAASSLLAALLKSFPQHAAADAAQPESPSAAAAAAAAAAPSGEMAALRLHQSASFTIESLVRRLGEEQQAEAATANCDLLLSCLPQVHHPARKLAEVLQQLLPPQQCGAASPAALLLLQRLVSEQHAELAAAACRSAELDRAAAALAASNGWLAGGDDFTPQVLSLLLVGDGSCSLLSEPAQAGLLSQLLQRLHAAADAAAAAGASTAEAAPAAAPVMQVVQGAVLSPALDASGSTEVRSLRLQLLAAALGLLLRDTAADAQEAAAAAEEAAALDATDRDPSTFVDESDLESFELPQQLGVAAAAARQLWQQAPAIGQLVRAAPAEQQAALAGSLQEEVQQSLEQHATPVAAAAVAEVAAQLLLPALAGTSVPQQLLQGLFGQQQAPDEGAAGSSSAAAAATGLDAPQALFVAATAAAAGFEALLPPGSPQASAEAAVSILAALEPVGTAAASEARQQLQQHIAVAAAATLLQLALAAAAAAAAASDSHAAVLSALLQQAVASGSSSTLHVAARWFAAATAEQQLSSDLLLQVLPVVGPAFRSSAELLQQSQLAELSQRLCQQCCAAEPAALGSVDGNPLQLLQAAVACFPCSTGADAAAQLPSPAAAAAGQQQQAGTAAAGSGSGSGSFSKGDAVWYSQQDGSWAEAEVAAVDWAVQPPSFSIRFTATPEAPVRETEGSRLRPRQPGQLAPPSAAQQAASAAAAAAVAAERQAAAGAALAPVGCCTPGEQAALLQLLQHEVRGTWAAAAAARAEGTAGGAEPSPGVAAAVAALLHSCMAYCGQQLSSQQWSLVLEQLRTILAACAASLAAAAARVAAAVCAAAAEVAVGADMSSPAVALQFFRRLKLKGVLERSAKARAEAGHVATKLAAELAALDQLLLPQLLPALQAYTRAAAAAAAGSSRSLAERDWQTAEAAVCGDALQLFVTAGCMAAAAAVCGGEAAAVLSDWMAGPLGAASADEQGAAVWQLLSQLVATTLRGADRAFLLAAVDRANAGMEATGVDALGALLALSLSGIPPAGTAGAAFAAILQHPELTAALTAAEGVDEEALEEQQQAAGGAASDSGDAAAALEQVGVRPELAAAVAGSPGSSGFYTGWALLMAHVLAAPADSHGRRLLAQSVKESHSLVPSLMDALVPLLPLDTGTGGRRRDSSSSAAGAGTPGGVAAAAAASGGAGTTGAGSSTAALFASQLAELGPYPSGHSDDWAALSPDQQQRAQRFAALLYAAVLQALPASARLWFADLRDRGTAAATERYTSAAVSGQLLAAELAAVTEAASAFGKFDKFSVRANATSREVIAVMEVEDGHMLELAVKLPAALPLRPPELECRRKVGVSEGRLRKWLLSISAFLRTQNGSVAEAISLWKRNVDKEFEGQEECLICYSIIQPTSGQLPRLGCRTCRKRFHGGCLYKWFKSSGKSNCPHCQSPW